MSGYQKVSNAESGKSYIDDPLSVWKNGLGEKNFMNIQEKIFIGPNRYKTGYIQSDKKSYPVSAKIHHKILSASPFAILGTSFNFSDGAELNNEQILVFKDKDMVELADGITRYLADQSQRTVRSEVTRRNLHHKLKNKIDDSTLTAEERQAN